MKALLPLLLLAACGGGPITGEDLQVRLELGSREVTSGRPFPLTVVLVWDATLEPEDWNDRALEPLQLRAEGTARRQHGERIEERRTFAAYAFGNGRVAVPAVSFRARDRSGAERIVASSRVNLEVLPALPAGAPGAPELPLELLPWPRSGTWVLPTLCAVALLLGSVWYVRSARRRVQVMTPPPVPEAVPEPPGAVALAGLQRLRAELAGDVEAFHMNAALVMRDYVGGRFGVTAGEMTTGELLRARPVRTAVKPPELALLRSVLGQCDLVKFAQHHPDASARSRLLSSAEQFLERTA